MTKPTDREADEFLAELEAEKIAREEEFGEEPDDFDEAVSTLASKEPRPLSPDTVKNILGYRPREERPAAPARPAPPAATAEVAALRDAVLALQAAVSAQAAVPGPTDVPAWLEQAAGDVADYDRRQSAREVVAMRIHPDYKRQVKAVQAAHGIRTVAGAWELVLRLGLAAAGRLTPINAKQSRGPTR